MTNEQLRQLLAIIQEQVARNPYFTFTYNWGIINSSDRIPTAVEIMRCISLAQFPPIGKN